MRPKMRRLFLSSALTAAALSLPALSLQAQALAPQAAANAPATLVADQLQLTGGSRLIARGAVEVLHQGNRLTARELHYDRATGALEIQGPITLTEPGGTVVLASAAELSADLRNGILRSARLVMDRQLQLAASEMHRIEGRHTVLSRAVASSCQVCADDPTPLWEIRARRIIHDQEERQIYFDHAQFHLRGVPVMWLPHLRMPDPTLRRARGVLAPRLITSSRLGFGIEVPYFVPLGPSRDITLTPLFATKEVRSLGLRYREAYRSGEVELRGALSFDETRGKRRGWLSAEARFDLPQDFTLRFRGRMISDPAYLRDYDLSDDDRLDSRLSISRIRRDELSELRLRHIHSIRDGEVNSELPQQIADVEWLRHYDVARLGGRLTLGARAHAHRRTSDLNSVGRDMTQLSLTALWRRNWQLGAGLLGAVELGGIYDLTRVHQDTTWPARTGTVTPMAMAELRWPWLRQGAEGTSDLIEPVVQLVWSRARPTADLPNSDSTLIEFDEGNLFGYSRFPGLDRREGGARLQTGISWTRIAPSGLTLTASAGRVWRFEDYQQFSAPTGLNGRRSDWVAALHLQTAQGLGFQGRIVSDDKLTLSRGEMRLGLQRPHYAFQASWLYQQANPAELRDDAVSEWTFDGRVKLREGWSALAATRYDFDAHKATAGGLGLEFENECLRVNLALTRKFSGAGMIRPSTNFSLSMDLLGVSGNATGRASARSCSF